MQTIIYQHRLRSLPWTTLSQNLTEKKSPYEKQILHPRLNHACQHHRLGRFLILHKGLSLWLGVGLCLVAAGLMIFSAFSCRHVRGPRIGNFIRTGLLVITTAITCWRAGIIETAVLALAAIMTGILALIGTRQQV
jgi:hypothetical protein